MPVEKTSEVDSNTLIKDDLDFEAEGSSSEGNVKAEAEEETCEPCTEEAPANGDLDVKVKKEKGENKKVKSSKRKKKLS